ncbi:MAG: DNA-3-methyladenine glycosylase [Gammaproteobacteria bacterium BRH_c0]|nr:MAG: DNA-3-methyladenine glycosylase [Gammaproteobacteria bacterium BRH_c0]
MDANLLRCPWSDTDALYRHYHDTEWGVPCYDDHKLFEFLVLESAQAGLSWITVLRKRDNYRKAFSDFDAQKVARYNNRSVERLMKNAGIVRNRQKIEAAISNARLFLEIQGEHGSFANYFWQFSDGKPVVNHFHTMQEVPATTALSDTISKDMKKRGFRFFGSTICYAHMQAVGMVNDHLVSCFRHRDLL